MSRVFGVPLPPSIREAMRTQQHPARAVSCPHCGAHEHRPCTTPSKRRLMPQPHPQRVSAWVREMACCPECQVEPGVPCHQDGVPLRNGDTHARRNREALETAA
ncbi:zinc finger domain-containing protein [Streptomyces noursei]|uniref:zinc finger domain-containing protein n=1 Tax=Streptomyces noursei TaxID=1971 RepID=UPI003FD6E2C2